MNYKQRLVRELLELEIKREKLFAYLIKNETITKTEQEHIQYELMKKQHEYMCDYKNILLERIDLILKENDN